MLFWLPARWWFLGIVGLLLRTLVFGFVAMTDTMYVLYVVSVDALYLGLVGSDLEFFWFGGELFCFIVVG